MDQEHFGLLQTIDKKVDEVKDKIHNVEIVQVRMENDLKYHIKRTDILEKKVFDIEEKIQPVEAAKETIVNISKILALFAGICIGVITILNFFKH